MLPNDWYLLKVGASGSINVLDDFLGLIPCLIEQPRLPVLSSQMIDSSPIKGVGVVMGAISITSYWGIEDPFQASICRFTALDESYAYVFLLFSH